MKRAFSLLVVAVIFTAFCVANAEDAEIRFRDIEWGLPMEEVIEEFISEHTFSLYTGNGINSSITSTAKSYESDYKLGADISTYYSLPFENKDNLPDLTYYETTVTRGIDMSVAGHEYVFAYFYSFGSDYDSSVFYKAKYVLSYDKDVYDDIYSKLEGIYGVYEKRLVYDEFYLKVQEAFGDEVKESAAIGNAWCNNNTGVEIYWNGGANNDRPYFEITYWSAVPFDTYLNPPQAEEEHIEFSDEVKSNTSGL